MKIAFRLDQDFVIRQTEVVRLSTKRSEITFRGALLSGNYALLSVCLRAK